MLQNGWLNCAWCQRLSEVFPASRLTGRALCKNTYLLKPNLFCRIPGPPHLTEACKTKMKYKKRQDVFQNQQPNKQTESLGLCMKPKGKASGMIQNYTIARQLYLNMEMGNLKQGDRNL